MKSEIRPVTAIWAIAVMCGFSITSEAGQIHLKITAPRVDSLSVPVHAVIELPEQLAGIPVEEISVELIQQGNLYANVVIPGQIVMNDKRQVELWWILPWARANSTSTWFATIKHEPRTNEEVFSWKDKKGEYLDLLFDGHRVNRYIYAYDNSAPQHVFETYKPFHHVFDAQGQNLLTNGPDGVHPYLKDEILYPHHRGVFIGWTKLEFAGKTYDFWGMGGGVAQRHLRFLEQTAGPVLARSQVLIHWNDKNGEPIVAEQRQTTVFCQSAPTVVLLDFHTELKAVRGEIFLDGDPEHGGFQYRAHNDVASGGEEVKATYLFHKDGIDSLKDKDLPWAAMSYGLNGRPYCVLHMNHPDNPKPTIYSAYRDYGRFGAFFKQKINAGETLMLQYLIWVLDGKMPKREELASKYSAFVDCPKVEVLGL